MPTWSLSRRQPTQLPPTTTAPTPPAAPNEASALIGLHAFVILLVGVLAAGGAAVGAFFSGCTLIEILGWAGATFVATVGFLKTVIR